jgi:hypothetical protein
MERLYRRFIRKFYLWSELLVIVGERKLLKMNKLCATMLIVCLVIFPVFVGFNMNSNSVSAQQETMIYIDPTPITANVCNNFTVALNVEYVTDLYAWEVKLSFNPDLLEYLGATEGPFLMSVGPTIWLPPEINNVEGTVLMACVLMIPPGASGNGTLAYIKFHCKGSGECDLAFVYPDTFLLDSYYNIIPCTAVNGHVIQQEATIYIDPTPVTTNVCENFTVALNVNNVTNLFAWEVKLSFDPTLMECLSVTYGPFLSSNGVPFVGMPPSINNTIGEIKVCASINWGSYTPKGVNGSGTLATITFHCTGIGRSSLHLHDTILLSSSAVQVVPPPNLGDINNDFIVNIKDVIIVALAYWSKPGDPNWNPAADLNNDGVVDIMDLIIVTQNYGHLYPPPGSHNALQPVNNVIPHSAVNGYVIQKGFSGYLDKEEPLEPVHLHPIGPFDPSNPIGSEWHELHPQYCNYYILTSWEDTDMSGNLSAADQIDLTNMDTGEVIWYNLDRLTWTINITELEPPMEQLYAELEYPPKQTPPPITMPWGTNWHVVYPPESYCRQFQIFDWFDMIPDGVLGNGDFIFAAFLDTGEPHICQVEEVVMDLILTKKCFYEPIGTEWHELYPQYCNYYNLTSWIDTNEDGKLSASDQIDLTDKQTEKVTWYNVDRVTLTINLTEEYVPEPVLLYAEFTGSFDMFYEPIMNPIGTVWHVIYPNENYSRIFQITSWEDNGDGVLSYCDQIDVEYADEPGVTHWYHIEQLACDIKISRTADIAVTNVKPYKTIVGQGYNCRINVTVTNEGPFPETFDLTIYAETLPPATPIGTVTVSNLLNSETRTITFTWNTTGFAYGNYTISAYATPVDGEKNTKDNNCTGGTVLVDVAGDVSGPTQGVPDGIVNIRDINYIVQLFLTRPPNWNPNADINNDGVVNIREINIIVQNFLKKWP